MVASVTPTHKKARDMNRPDAKVLLLRRLSYGAHPDKGGAGGAKAWLEAQLSGELPEDELDKRLASFSSLQLSDTEIIHRYPSGSQITAHMQRYHPGIIPPRDEPIVDFSVIAKKRDAFAAEQGYSSQWEYRNHLLGQKVVRAVYAQNQLRELMTDFWQNHFFTGSASFNARMWLMTYERDALRPNALGNFRELLGAVVKHPGWLSFYQGSESPMEVAPEQTTLAYNIARLRQTDSAAADQLSRAVEREIRQVEHEEDLILPRQFWPKRGPNREMARALIKLQTLGPEGSVSEGDLTVAARVLTGWSVMPYGATDQWFVDGFDRALQAGFVRKEGFLFRADWHDARAKRFMGQSLSEGGGLDEGEQLLDILAAHPQTARNISRKLAEYFVSDTPSAEIVEYMAWVFTATKGNIAKVIEAMVAHDDFWLALQSQEKVKTPLQFAASAIRWLPAELNDPQAVIAWIGRMGQPLYGYQEPTGYPSDGRYWLDPAGLLARMNFAQALVSGEISGVLPHARHSASSQQLTLVLAGPDFQLR